jgi:hypothetical protein
LQVVALLVTGNLDCTAETSCARAPVPEMPADRNADITRKRLEKYLASGLPVRAPGDHAVEDGSRMSKAERLAVFKGDISAWGGPSLGNLILQCGDGSLVSDAIQILSDTMPSLGGRDQYGRLIDRSILATHHLEEQPEGFLQLVRRGRPGQPPVESGIVPSFNTTDVPHFIRQSLRSNARFRDAVSLADRLAEDGALHAADPPAQAEGWQASFYSKQQVMAIVTGAANDGKHIRRIDFFSWFGTTPFDLGKKELEGLWAEVPLEWRNQGGGRLPQKKRVSDWRAYDPR